MGSATFVRGHDEDKFPLLHSAYPPNSISHKALSRRVTVCSCGARRFRLLLSSLCLLFGSMGRTCLRKFEGIILRRDRALLLHSHASVSELLRSRITRFGALLRVDGCGSHL